MGMSASGTGAVKSSVGSLVKSPFFEKSLLPLVQVWRRKRGNSWLLTGPERNTRQWDLNPQNRSKGKACTTPLPLPVLRAWPQFQWRNFKKDMSHYLKKKEQVINLKQQLSPKSEKKFLLLGVKVPSSSALFSPPSKKTFAPPPTPKSLTHTSIKQKHLFKTFRCHCHHHLKKHLYIPPDQLPHLHPLSLLVNHPEKLKV